MIFHKMNYKNICERIDKNTLKVKLTLNQFALVDDNTSTRWLLINYRWCSQQNGKTFYMCAKKPKDMNFPNYQKRKTIKFHQEYLNIKGLDHKNRNGLDNRKENLREVSLSHQQFNKDIRKSNTSGTIGVHLTTHGKYKIIRGRINKGDEIYEKTLSYNPDNFEEKIEIIKKWRKEKELELYGEHSPN